MSASVLVIGDATIDVHAIPSEPIRAGGDVPATIRLEPGGQGANVAVRLARRGVEVRLAGALGQDRAGAILRELLASEGVQLRDASAEATGLVVVLRDRAGERTMLSQRASVLGPGFDADALTSADWVVLSGYVFLERGVGISASGPHPRRVVLGCALARGDVAGWTDAVAAFAPHLVVLNLDEARDLRGASLEPAEAAAGVADRFGAVAVVTHPSGAAGWVGGRAVTTPSRTEGSVVDTTGAGDAFAASLIHGLLDVPWSPAPDRLERLLADAVADAAAASAVAGAQGRIDAETATVPPL